MGNNILKEHTTQHKSSANPFLLILLEALILLFSIRFNFLLTKRDANCVYILLRTPVTLDSEY